jgi:hypothetical protein
MLGASDKEKKRRPTKAQRDRRALEAHFDDLATTDKRKGRRRHKEEAAAELELPALGRAAATDSRRRVKLNSMTLAPCQASAPGILHDAALRVSEWDAFKNGRRRKAAAAEEKKLVKFEHMVAERRARKQANRQAKLDLARAKQDHQEQLAGGGAQARGKALRVAHLPELEAAAFNVKMLHCKATRDEFFEGHSKMVDIHG